MARYPQGILVACPTPWDDRFELVEELLREEVRRVLAAGFRHCYVFGTGGEGYAVDTRRFRQVVDVFHEETRGSDVSAMVGVIGLSTPQILERLEYAHDVGFRMFQVSLPSWGPLNDIELLRFFSDTCGRFPDSRFLHYNLPRTKRVLGGRDYARLIPEIPNLVATKTTGGGMAAAEELVRDAGDLQHFMGEGNFPHGSMFGECSLLASYAELSPRMTNALFEAGQTRDAAELMRLQHAFQRLGTDLWAQPAPGPHMDGAYDKMLVKLGMLPEFPLRLLSPYQGFTEDDYRACRRLLETDYRAWLEDAVLAT
ncbi:MAG: dihydrodipicolinate synthase family protein [Chloroflexi bacterium]|nr:dihydrodipicolinate synthase family protein [Chloroflexota bacterium]